MKMHIRLNHCSQGNTRLSLLKLNFWLSLRKRLKKSLVYQASFVSISLCNNVHVGRTRGEPSNWRYRQNLTEEGGGSHPLPTHFFSCPLPQTPFNAPSLPQTPELPLAEATFCHIPEKTTTTTIELFVYKQ